MAPFADQRSVRRIGELHPVEQHRSRLLALVTALRKQQRPAWLDQMAWMLELLLVVRALVGLGPLLGDDHPDSTSTYVGYLVASVCVLPIAMKSVQGDRATWSSAVIAVASLAIAVVAVRLEMTS